MGVGLCTGRGPVGRQEVCRGLSCSWLCLALCSYPKEQGGQQLLQMGEKSRKSWQASPEGRTYATGTWLCLEPICSWMRSEFVTSVGASGFSNFLNPGNSQATRTTWVLPLALASHCPGPSPLSTIVDWAACSPPPSLPHLSRHFSPVFLNNLGKMRLSWLSQLGPSKLASLGILADRQNSQHIIFSCQQTHCLPLSKGYRELQSRPQGGTVEDIIFFVLLLGCLCVGEG